MKHIAAVIVMLLAACASILGLKGTEPQAFPHRKHAIAGVPCTKRVTVRWTRAGS